MATPVDNNLMQDEAELLFQPPEGVQNPRFLQIAIVGCGVAGLLTARVLKGRGFKHLVLFEASDKLGGVWSHGYPNYGVQTPGSLYEFPDKALPSPKDYKPGPHVQRYCEDYAKEHKLMDLIQWNRRVCKIERCKIERFPSGGRTSSSWKWTVITEASVCNKEKKSEGMKEEKKTFDFVILATGLYGIEQKYVPPAWEGREHFEGIVCHSLDTGDLQDERRGKKVIVVGFGRSAHDCAMNAWNETGVPPVLLFRASHWCVPRKVLGIIPMEWLIYSRFGQGTLPPWQDCGPMEWIFQAMGLIWFYWRLVEILFSLQLGWYGTLAHLRPTLPIEEDMYCGHGVICHPDFFPMVQQGRIQAVEGEIDKVLPSGNLLLKSGEELEADEIVLATGYKRQLDFLPQELKDSHEKDGIYAFRNMIVPGVCNIAFLNSNVTTFSNITTPGIQAAWLAELLLDHLDVSAVRETVKAEQEWRRQHLTKAKGDYKAIFVQLHQLRYWDTLLRDMGINIKRKTGGPIFACLKNFFEPLASCDYKSVITGEWKISKQEIRPTNYTPTYWFEWTMLGLLLIGPILALRMAAS